MNTQHEVGRINLKQRFRKIKRVKRVKPVQPEPEGPKVSEALQKRLEAVIKSRDRKCLPLEGIVRLCEEEIDRQILEQRSAWRADGNSGDGRYKCFIFPDVTPDALVRVTELYSRANWQVSHHSESGVGDYLLLTPSKKRLLPRMKVLSFTW